LKLKEITMWRRTLGAIVLLGYSILVTPLIAAAQQAGRVPRVIILYGSPREVHAPLAKALEDQLGSLGYINGQNIHLEHRGTNGTPTQLREVVAEVVPRKPDVLVVWGTLGAVTVQQATSSLPVVFLSVGVPVEIGLVASLRHPGGNMTGVTFEAAAETYARRLQLLQEVVPTLSRVALLYAVGDANVAHAIEAVERAAPVLGLTVELFVSFRRARVCDMKVASVAVSLALQAKTKPAGPPAVPSRSMRSW
jgi:putative ABC transport system substrate-binding protein